MDRTAGLAVPLILTRQQTNIGFRVTPFETITASRLYG